MAPCSITPILQRGKPLEHAVEDHRGQRLHRRPGDGHVVDRAEVLVAAVEVGRDRRRRSRSTSGRAAARRRRRGTRSGCRPPRPVAHTGSSPMWLGEWPVRAGRRDEQGGGAHVDRLARPWPPSGRSRPAARSRWAAAAGRPSRTRPCRGCGRGRRRRRGRGRRCARAGRRPLLNVLKTSWLATPSRSRASGRSSAMNAAGGLEVLAGHDLLGVAGPELGVGVPGPHLLDASASPGAGPSLARWRLAAPARPDRRGRAARWAPP